MVDVAADECPMCGAPGSVRYRPFCSKRCANRDLGLWFTGAYSVPVTDEEEFSETPPVAANDDE